MLYRHIISAVVIPLWLFTVPALAQGEGVNHDKKLSNVGVSADVSQTEELSGQTSTTSRAAVPSSSLALPLDFPLGLLRIGGQSAVVPDWRLLTFRDFPRFVTDGQWGDVQWKSGDSIVDVLTLGDFQQDLQLHLLTIEGISNTLGVPSEELKNISLSEFQLLERQTLRTLVQAVPSLLDEPLEDIPFIEELVLGVTPSLITSNIAVADILEQDEYGDIRLGYLTLSQYTLDDVPGIEAVPFQAFASWQEATIRDIPLLEYVNWWSFPKQVNLDGAIAITSVVTEAGVNAVHVADDEEDDLGFHVQLDSFEDNRQPIIWQVGETQAGGVGQGELAQLNEGREPSGIMAFGGVFNMVVQEATATGFQTVIYFRTCRSDGNKGDAMDCSPYIIGPIPFIEYKPGSNIFLGQVAFQSLLPEPGKENPEVESVEEPNLIDTLLPSNTAKVAAGGSVALILTLMLAFIYWAFKGDPVGFVQGTAQWAWASYLRSRDKGR